MGLQHIAPLIEADHYFAVEAATFGHLATPPGTYFGWIVFIFSAYGGDVVPVNFNFEGVQDNPWIFRDVLDFISEKSLKIDPGHVYRFDGTHTKYRNGKYRFTGKTRLVTTGDPS